MAEFFEANPAEIAESSIEGGHAGGLFLRRTEMKVGECTEYVAKKMEG